MNEKQVKEKGGTVGFICPHCGKEIETYFENLEPDEAEVTILWDLNHSEEWECKRGCSRGTLEKAWCVCEHCGEEVYMIWQYEQPCNANGYTVEMFMFKEEVELDADE